jgi:hypothetical protein
LNPSGPPRGAPDAVTLVGLLADPDRRAVMAAVVLGATGLDEVVARTDLDVGRAGKALARLVYGGMVQRGAGGELKLDDDVFAAAARRAHEAAAPAPPPADEREVVLRRWIVDGRLSAIPTKHSVRLVVLDHLAQAFEPGERYSEAAVNLMLGRVHADTAALRRYLVDEGFLERESGVYWRAGGSVDV